jgi:hypothetical protein
MEWETPEFVDISLACEISGYANAELSAAVWSGTEALDAFRERLAPASPQRVTPPSPKTEGRASRAVLLQIWPTGQ